MTEGASERRRRERGREKECGRRGERGGTEGRGLYVHACMPVKLGLEAVGLARRDVAVCVEESRRVNGDRAFGGAGGQECVVQTFRSGATPAPSGASAWEELLLQP